MKHPARISILALLLGIASPAHAQTFNAERYWSVEITGQDSSCTAAARSDGGIMMLVFTAGLLTIGATGSRVPSRGTAGTFTIDGQAFPFQADLSPAGILSKSPFSSRAVSVLRSAKRELRVSLDRRTVLSLDLADSGTGQLVTDLFDCSMGKAGWWGKGSDLVARVKGEAPAEGQPLLPPAPPSAPPGSIPMGPAGSR